MHSQKSGGGEESASFSAQDKGGAWRRTCSGSENVLDDRATNDRDDEASVMGDGSLE